LLFAAQLIEDKNESKENEEKELINIRRRRTKTLLPKESKTQAPTTLERLKKSKKTGVKPSLIRRIK
jgi:hypothetical protein